MAGNALFKLLNSVIFLEEFGKAFVPKRIRPFMRLHFLKAGITEVPYKLFGGIFYISLIGTVLAYFRYVYPLFDIDFSLAKVFLYTAATFIILPLGLVVLLAFAYYFYLDMRIFNRTKRMEDVLPDFLRLVAENLKGGMSFENALWSSIKPEFGVLAAEVRLAAKKVMTGQDVEDALDELTSKYRSPILTRAFDLILAGMKGGGRIADIIDRIIEDIDEANNLKAEMKATNLSYIIFVTFVVIVVTPALFTLSFQFLIVLKSMAAKIAVSSSGSANVGLPISFGKVNIDTEGFKMFSMYAVGMISFFASIIVSIISSGTVKGGIKLVPIYILGSILIYKVMMLVVGTMFKGLVF